MPGRFKDSKYFKRLYELTHKSLYFPPLVVFIAILVITIWPWHNARQTTENNLEQSMQEHVRATQDAVKERFSVYHTSLQSGAALLEVSPNTTKDQWDTFFTYKQIVTNRPGMQGIGFIRVFQESDLPQVQAFMQTQGLGDFSVYPDAADDDGLRSAILYVYSPTASSNFAVGYDMFSQPQRKAAMVAARDSGVARFTHKVALVQDTQTGDGYGFLLYVPVYKNGLANTTTEQRRENITGYVYGGFRAKALFRQILEPRSTAQGYAIEVYDENIAEDNLLYKTDNTEQLARNDNKNTRIESVTLYGARWQLKFYFDETRILSRSELNAAVYIVIVGTVTATVVFLALLLIFKSRTRELNQERDREINIAKDELLSLASHQMRTPATGVKQYLGMVLQGFTGSLKEPQRRILEKAYSSNERQLQVINQILHLARLESGRIVLAKHVTNINELVQDIIDEQKGELEAAGHTLTLDLPNRPVLLKIDSHMIRMAIENIINNSIKYTIEPGAISVKVSRSRSQVTIAIQDSGVGIDQKQLANIFKQFTRLYDEKTEQVSGTGIGLYLAEQMIRLHRGTLEVESTAGEGSTFTVTLPRTKFKKK